MTKEKMLQIEKKALNINTPFILIMALSGLIFGYLSHSSAIVLDGIFSSILFLTIFLAKVIQKQAAMPRSYIYPMGKWYLDNVYNLFKVLILVGILSVSFIESIVKIVEFYFGILEVPPIIHFYADIYYVVKLAAFFVAFFVYKHYSKKALNRSEFLKIETKGVFIDGIITISIALGFFFLGGIEPLEPVIDSIILFGISLFLLIKMYSSGISYINQLLGKRIFLQREEYYAKIINKEVKDVDVLDLYIKFSGKSPVVVLTCTYEGSKDIDFFINFEHIVKDTLRGEFGEVYLNMYFDYEENFKKSKIPWSNKKL